MTRREMVVKLLAVAGVSGVAAGCGGGNPGNIPEEKVITQERSDEMAKGLQEGMKNMNKAAKKR